MIRLAYIQERANGRLDVEAAQVARELGRRRVPVQLFTEKRIVRRQLAIAGDTLVVGQVPVVLAALRQLGVAAPEPNDYPACLRPMLRRRVWESTVAEVADALAEGRLGAFVKPKGRLKHFTGFVAESAADVWRFGGTSRRQAVWCSEIVRWRSEHRYFVVGGEIVGARPYDGDAATAPDEGRVRDAIAALGASGELRAGFGIDVGVLSNGETALVEMNDGFSLGAYGLDDAAYTDLLIARWQELTAVT